jgi:hypothetical protein
VLIDLGLISAWPGRPTGTYTAKSGLIIAEARTLTRGNYGSTLGGSMGKVREREIILKTDQRDILLEMGLGENSKRDQADGTRTESFSKAMFVKLKYAMAAGC